MKHKLYFACLARVIRKENEYKVRALLWWRMTGLFASPHQATTRPEICLVQLLNVSCHSSFMRSLNMESFSAILVTHIIAFSLGLIISKYHQLSSQYTKSILIELSKLLWKLSGPFSSENARAPRAPTSLDSINVELLNR